MVQLHTIIMVDTRIKVGIIITWIKAIEKRERGRGETVIPEREQRVKTKENYLRDIKES